MRTYKLKKFKLLIIFIAVCLTVTLGWILYGPNGVNDYARISSELDKLNSDIEALTEQNKSLQEEIIKLKNDKHYIEDVARKDYGFLKKNEMVFEFKK